MRLPSEGFEKTSDKHRQCENSKHQYQCQPLCTWHCQVGNPSKVIYLGRLLVFGLTLGCPGLALLAPVYPFHLPLSAEWVSSYYITGSGCTHWPEQQASQTCSVEEGLVNHALRPD